VRADICDPGDTAAVERFREALRRLGADPSGEGWALGVDVCRLKIGRDELTIFSDPWSVDVEGPDALVQRLIRELQMGSDPV
jgi:hypothetical protein